jgi:mRNA-degrading endonuclease RelE of RelBE toxin-antitoxin system
MFQVDFTPKAEADLARLDKSVAQRVQKIIVRFVRRRREVYRHGAD